MLQFSPEQIESLELSRRQALLQRLVVFVRERCQVSFPQRTSLLPATAAELEQSVDVQLRRAERWGLDDERSVAAYVALGFCLNPAFDEQPAIRAILANGVLTPPQRMEQVYEYLARAEEKYLDGKFSAGGGPR